jgi:glycerol-3-phosphate O-acyltransferase
MAKTPTDIRSLARAHTETAIRTLAGIMEQAAAPHAARVAAAQALLDRGWGKAVQYVEAEVAHRYVARMPEKAKDITEWQQQHTPHLTTQ